MFMPMVMMVMVGGVSVAGSSFESAEKLRYLQRLPRLVDRDDRVMQTLRALLMRVAVARIAAKKLTFPATDFIMPL